MKPPAKLLFAACLTMLVAVTSPGGANAAEDAAQAQDLVQVRATSWVSAARWIRRTDSYVLQVVLDPSKFASSRAKAAANPAAPLPAQEGQQVPLMTLPPTFNAAAIERMDRGSSFIAATIADLRGLDPTFCGRTLTLVDGRRSADGQPTRTPATPLSVNQPYPPRIKDGRVDVWLLKADGTQILPAIYSCDKGARLTPTESPPVEITYEFPLAGAEQAVAAAIRIGDDYYIEKLQPQVPRPAAL